MVLRERYDKVDRVLVPRRSLLLICTERGGGSGTVTPGTVTHVGPTTFALIKFAVAAKTVGLLSKTNNGG